jgi:hypothetical protein
VCEHLPGRLNRLNSGIAARSRAPTIDFDGQSSQKIPTSSAAFTALDEQQPRVEVHDYQPLFRAALIAGRAYRPWVWGDTWLVVPVFPADRLPRTAVAGVLRHS